MWKLLNKKLELYPSHQDVWWKQFFYKKRFPLQLNNYTEQSSSWEADSRSASIKIPCVLQGTLVFSQQSTTDP
jgi:hypothetical protein